MAFADNLKQLPSVIHLAALHLVNEAGNVVTTIENMPSKAGSLSIYAALAVKHGSINVAAAQEGLELFAEHTTDACAHPGHHPNIDQLLEVIASGEGFSVMFINA